MIRRRSRTLRLPSRRRRQAVQLPVSVLGMVGQQAGRLLAGDPARHVHVDKFVFRHRIYCAGRAPVRIASALCLMLRSPPLPRYAPPPRRSKPRSTATSTRSSAGTGDDDPAVYDAFNALAAAAEVYDELLYDRYDEVTPFEIPGAEDSLPPYAGPDEPSALSVLIRRDYAVVGAAAAARPGPAGRRRDDRGRRDGTRRRWSAPGPRRAGRALRRVRTGRDRLPAQGVRPGGGRLHALGLGRGRAARAGGVARRALRATPTRSWWCAASTSAPSSTRSDDSTRSSTSRTAGPSSWSDADAARPPTERAPTRGRRRGRDRCRHGRLAGVSASATASSSARQPGRRGSWAGTSRHRARQRLVHPVHHGQMPLAPAERGVDPGPGQRLRRVTRQHHDRGRPAHPGRLVRA